MDMELWLVNPHKLILESVGEVVMLRFDLLQLLDQK
jgi:hypothetical protein